VSSGDVRRDTGREPAGGGVRAHIRVPGGVLARHASARDPRPQRAAVVGQADQKLAEHGHANHDEQLSAGR